MRLRSGHAPPSSLAHTPGSWLSLPTDIRLLILELVTQADKTCRGRTGSAGGKIFRRATTNLYSALQLQKSSTIPEGGLTLELNVFSPSDGEHWFKHFHFDNDGDDDDPGPEPGRLTPTWHDPYHGWDHGQLVQEPPGPAIDRLFTDIEPAFPWVKEALPNVHTVTRLVMRRQMHRTLSGHSIGVLLGALCCLEHLVLEPWRPWQMYNQSRSFTELYPVVSDVLPRIKTLKSICIFEDFNENIARILHEYWAYVYGPDEFVPLLRPVDHTLGQLFVPLSLTLERLAVSYMIEAEDFFTGCAKPGFMCEHLQSLALTSRSLYRRGSHQAVEDLLCHAGQVALLMPKLQTLAIWSGAKGVASAFIYRVTAGTCASIQWRGLWSLDLSGRVQEAWQRVADKFGLFGPCLEEQQLITEPILSHGDAIYHLNLPCQVVSPVSLWQIRKEGAMSWRH